MFRAIVKRDGAGELCALSAKFSSSGNFPAAFLCLDRLFSTSPKLQTASLAEIANKLQTFLIYARMLHKLSTFVNPCDDPIIRRIFALQSSTEDLFLLHGGSFMATQCNAHLTPSARSAEQGTVVPRWELDRLVKHVLKSRLLRGINDENNLCRSLRPLQPCLTYAVFNQCNRVECPRHHGDYRQYDTAAYNARVRVHMLQILIYHTLYTVENPEEFARQQR